MQFMRVNMLTSSENSYLLTPYVVYVAMKSLINTGLI